MNIRIFALAVIFVDVRRAVGAGADKTLRVRGQRVFA